MPAKWTPFQYTDYCADFGVGERSSNCTGGRQTMITSTRVRRIFIVEHWVDFRKGHPGLLAEAFRLGRDPYAGDLLIFVGRNRRTLKVLYADPSGLWVSHKQFTGDFIKTKLRFLSDPTATEITQAEMAMILEGAAYSVQRRAIPYTVNDHLKPAFHFT